MSKKSDKLGFLPARADNFSPAFAENLIDHVQNGYKPSYSLPPWMRGYELEAAHLFLVVNLFQLVYPGLLLSSVGAGLYKNSYPASTAFVSGSGFDGTIDDRHRKSYTPQ